MLGKVHYWHWIKEILWKVSFLQRHLKIVWETVCLLNQCIGEENQGQLQNYKELKIVGLQKTDERKKVSYFKTVSKKKEKLKKLNSRNLNNKLNRKEVLNDISEKNLHLLRLDELATQITEVGKLCQLFGVKNVAIFSILLKSGESLNVKIHEVNSYSREKCEFYNIDFISNENISVKYLHSDGVHLNDVGSYCYKKILENIFLVLFD